MSLLLLETAAAGPGFFRSFLEPLALLGYLGQLAFSARFIVQWYASEKAKQSVVPKAFWYLSLIGSVILLVYACLEHQPVIFVGQLPGFVVYSRNLMLLARARKLAATSATT